ncbi:hypothetical protein PINS_up007455 [Pythium insidiosum]|nr:hypothetical protein PINS_up007455 [Pythium insidiosum]
MPATMTTTTTVVDTFDRLRAREKERFREERKGRIPVMDAETLKELCLDNDGYETPELNDNLYAHFQGFQKIEGLAPYYNLKALWLESNGLSRIENLTPLVNLRCLYLSKNLLERVENLEALRELNTLDLSENRIKTLTGLACLPRLSSLNVSRNVLADRADIEELARCAELTNVDVSHNRLHDTSVLEVFQRMPKLRALRITGNEVVSTTKAFRKRYISSLPALAFLDRPIFPLERAGVDAWVRGGHAAELEAKRAFVSQEHEERRRHLQEFRDWQAQVRERRLQEIAAAQAEEKEKNAETPETSEVEVELHGFRGITKEQYARLSAEQRAVWDERIAAAHRDSVRDRHEVLGDGVRQLGAKFWATNDGAPGQEREKREAVTEPSSTDADAATVPRTQSVAETNEKTTTDETIESSPPPLPQPAPPAAPATTESENETALPCALPAEAKEAEPSLPPQSPMLMMMPPPAPSQLAVKPSPGHATTEVLPPPPAPATIATPERSTSASTTSTESAARVFHRDPRAFFRDVGETRRSWAELEQQAREAPFTHRPLSLPSVVRCLCCVELLSGKPALIECEHLLHSTTTTAIMTPRKTRRTRRRKKKRSASPCAR